MRYNSFTHEKFIEELEKRNDCYKNKEFEVLETYKNAHSYIKIKDKYGICKVKPLQLLLGHCSYINSAIDKNLYFHNWLLDTNIHYRNKCFEIVGDYVHIKRKILVKTKYSYHEVSPDSLVRGTSVDIRNSIDKNLYLKNMYSEIHDSYYTYEKLNYIKQTQKITVTCKKHGNFDILPLNHSRGQGCYYCGLDKISNHNIENPVGWSINEWINASKRSKNFDSFKVYVIRCWNDNEEFYKIGRTFNKVSKRFMSKKSLPYNYEIVNLYIGDAHEMFYKERELHIELSSMKYIPLINFAGMYECFNKDINIKKFKYD